METLEAQVYTNNIHSLETTTMGEDMVDDESEDEAAEAKVAGGGSSQQKCNGGAPDEANTAHSPDGYGNRSTMLTSTRSVYNVDKVDALCSTSSTSSSTSSMTSGDGRSRSTSRMSSHARRWNRGRHTPSMETVSYTHLTLPTILLV